MTLKSLMLGDRLPALGRASAVGGLEVVAGVGDQLIFYRELGIVIQRLYN